MDEYEDFVISDVEYDSDLSDASTEDDEDSLTGELNEAEANENNVEESCARQEYDAVYGKWSATKANVQEFEYHHSRPQPGSHLQSESDYFFALFEDVIEM